MRDQTDAQMGPTIKASQARTIAGGKQDQVGFLPNRVVRGDCLRLLTSIPTESVDLVLSDLPYGQTRNQWDKPIPLESLWEQYRRIIKPRGVIALTATGAFVADLIDAARDLFRYQIVWRKNKPTGFLNAKRRPLRAHELVLVFYKAQPTFSRQMTSGHKPSHACTRRPRKDGRRHSPNYGFEADTNVTYSGGLTKRHPTDVLDVPIVNNDDPIKKHPTQKPVPLGEWFIKSFTRDGDLVVDNACGTGAFLVAAKRLGRRYWGCDLSQGYCAEARRRLASREAVPPGGHEHGHLR